MKKIIHIDVTPEEPWVALCGVKTLSAVRSTQGFNVMELCVYLREGMYAGRVMCKKCENHPHFDLHILALTELE